MSAEEVDVEPCTPFVGHPTSARTFVTPGVRPLLDFYPEGVHPGPKDGVPALPPRLLRVEVLPSEGGVSRVTTAPSSGVPDGAGAGAEAGHPRYSQQQPFMATIVNARYLTAGGSASDRRVIHMELDLSGSGISYVPGDSIGISCPNDGDMVDMLIERLGYPIDTLCAIHADGAGAGSSAHHFPHQCSLRDALLHHVDLTSPPKKSFLRLLAEHATDGDRVTLTYLSSRAGKTMFSVFVEEQRLTLLDLLNLFPSCTPPLDHLLSALSPLPPRMYSVASSPLVSPTRVAVAFTVVAFECKATSDACTTTVRRIGLCTNWLERKCLPFLSDVCVLSTAARLPIFHKPTKDFILPGSTETPLIMVGPGTGVAPFLGFLEHRSCRRQQLTQERGSVCTGAWRTDFDVALIDDSIKVETFGDVVLFFGNRHMGKDFLYQEELRRFVDNRTLTCLHTAFSRDQEEKLYVQHRMREHGAKLASMILDDVATLYICGDGASMARDVEATIKQLFQEHRGLSSEDANAVFKDLVVRRKILQDVWS